MLQTQHKSILEGLGFSGSHFERLNLFLERLWKENLELNLISRKMTEEELINNHVIDCFLPLNHFPKNLKVVADLGTGGGLPGILYAINYPETHFLLYEKSPQKRRFLESCSDLCPNIEVREHVTLNLPEANMVIARGFKPIPVILELTSNYYRSKGPYFLLKGRKEKIDEELLDAKKKMKDLSAKVVPLHSPVLEVERHLVLINN